MFKRDLVREKGDEDSINICILGNYIICCGYCNCRVNILYMILYKGDFYK